MHDIKDTDKGASGASGHAAEGASAEGTGIGRDDPLTPNQRAWVNALRSGKYEQTSGLLTRVDRTGAPVGYCCLGVACDLAVKAGVIQAPVVQDNMFAYNHERDDVGTAYLPEIVEKWLAIRSGDGRYSNDEIGSLTRANDRGMTFAEIADLIEQHHETLFVKPEPVA